MSSILDEDKKITLIYHQEKLLFQRFNYFLIGIAFLVTALAAIVSSEKLGSNYDMNVGRIANAICIVGYLLSWFFLVVNFMNAKAIKLYWELLSEHQLWIQQKSFIAFNMASWEIEHYKYLFLDLIKQSYYSIIKPFDEKSKNTAPHTWLVPGLFVIFWGLTWSWLPNREKCTLGPIHFYPWLFYILVFLPLLLLIGRDYYYYLKNIRDP